MPVQQFAGGQLSWSRLPVCPLAELTAGVAAGPAYVVLSRTVADRAVAAGVPATAATSGVPTT